LCVFVVWFLLRVFFFVWGDGFGLCEIVGFLVVMLGLFLLVGCWWCLVSWGFFHFFGLCGAGFLYLIFCVFFGFDVLILVLCEFWFMFF